MKAGHFRFKNVSTGDLNRGRRTESRVLFGHFLHDAKSDNPFSFAGSFEVLQTSEQRTKNTFSHNSIKSFRRHRRHFFLLFVKYKKESKKRFRLSAVSCCCRNIFAACGGSEAWASPRLTGAASRRFSRRQAWLRSWQIAEIPHIKAP